MAEQKGDTGLPGEILRLLGEGGVRECEILHSARTDMNAEGVYADGWLVLTGDRLCAFQAPPDPGKIRYYKGYGTRREESLQAGKDYSPAFYALKDLENLRIETGVGCNLLLAGEEFLTLLLLVLAMTATKIVLLLFQILQGVLTAQMVPDVVWDMKKDVFSQMSRLSIGFYKSRQTGSLMTCVMSDADRIKGFFVDGAARTLPREQQKVPGCRDRYQLSAELFPDCL